MERYIHTHLWEFRVYLTDAMANQELDQSKKNILQSIEIEKIFTYNRLDTIRTYTILYKCIISIIIFNKLTIHM